MADHAEPRPANQGILKSLLISVSLVSGLVLVVAALSLLSEPDKRSVERRLLIEKHDKMRLDMTVAEVDGLMEGHPREEHRGGTEILKLGGRRLPRPCLFYVTYDGKPGATEGDYYLMAFFEKEGRLVEKGLDDYLK